MIKYHIHVITQLDITKYVSKQYISGPACALASKNVHVKAVEG